MYQMLIESQDPNRFLPSTWNFHRSPGLTVWETALNIAQREKVILLGVIDKEGKEVPRHE